MRSSIFLRCVITSYSIHYTKLYEDLIQAQLAGADLHGANLSMANLRRANLQKADLRKAVMVYANLPGADLRGADLVITSYSIHYTKLYEKLCNKKAGNESRLFCCSQTILSAWLQGLEFFHKLPGRNNFV